MNLTLRQLTNEDLQWELDSATERGNQRRHSAVLRELDRRSVSRTA